jgi:ABC-type polysaccharide/polyol phosphate export permease
MFASGKMFVANSLATGMAAMFWWNPLFHIIDQGRGYIFINYVPHKTNLWYPLAFTAAVFALGCIAVAYTNRHQSLSWNAAR